MRSNRVLCSAVAGAALLVGSVYADASSASPIVVRGKHFFYSSNHTEFFIRGVAYQQNYNAQTTGFSGNTYTDPLANGQACKRDIPYLAQLRTNTIRTYAIDPTKNHDECMNALADAGIYVIADLSSPTESINSKDPDWTTELFTRYAAVVDSLSQYNNVIGFFAGNEVINTSPQSPAAAFVKAAVRDTKAYIKANVQRPLYVGYATSDVPLRDQLADYFSCGPTSESVDFWGYNIYSWCGDSNYVTSGYNVRTDFFRDYPVPAFFAEYGCNQPPGQPRQFTETLALYGPKMSPVWAGGIVYQYFQTPNDFGLITLNGNSVSTLPDFKNLQTQMGKINPTIQSYNSVDMGSPTTCPATSSKWRAKASPLPPAANPDLCTCLQKSLSCVVKDSVPMKQYAKQFKYICGQSPEACAGIASDPAKGSYGSYSPCDAKSKLSYVMNKYWEMNGKDSTACDFGGAATIQTSSMSGSCKSLISSVGSDEQGPVPEPTSAPAPSSGSSSGGGNAAAGLTVPKLGASSVIAGLIFVGILAL